MSARRFEKEGFLKVWATWAAFGLYYTFIGLPTKQIISYHMPGGKYYK